jgi:predicted CXXCH cytochrome family protein
LTFAFGGVAYANFGPHGGYLDDTDACAGCHRAHTSFTELTWTDDTVAGAQHSALLISSASSMSEFCNACHGDDAPGASTNVVSGVFDAGPSGASTAVAGDDNAGVQVEYLTSSSFDATLNGGGFLRMPEGTRGAPNTYKLSTSAHDMDLGVGVTDPMWGDGTQVPASANLTCTGCHDPHGSSNYRLLKDAVNGNTVGGYINDDNPTPFVISAEVGYPTVGWRKHENGAAQMAGYRPNYTTAQYRNNGDAAKNISGWCAGCHEAYIVRNDVTAGTSYDYGDFIENNAGTNLGVETFHRHPVNVSLVAGDPSGYVPPAVVQTSWLRTAVAFDDQLPLEMRNNGDPAAFRAGTKTYEDYLGCLTCHRAHGSSADMTGWAEASLESTNGTDWYPERLAQPTEAGVNPNFTSALLRTDNRGVCERCHNK